MILKKDSCSSKGALSASSRDHTWEEIK
jgi:hypothetical protein